jgi:hypothetical protein
MRITLAHLGLGAVLCFAATPYLAAADGDGDIVRKTGRLQVVLDGEENVTSATLVCETKDEWGDDVSYVLVLTGKSRKQAAELKDKKVLVIGVLKVNEDEDTARIRVSSITAAVDKAGAPVLPGEPGKPEKPEKPEKPAAPKADDDGEDLF